MGNDITVGDIVKSTSGHDINRLFLVVSIDKNGYFGIIDGRFRGKNNPKTKNPKHLVKIAHDDGLIEKYNSPITTDAEIHKLIKKYQKE